jgi:hypothetical protein
MTVQDNWRWCKKCQGLAYAAGSSLGHCAAGGTHDHTGSGDYALVVNDATVIGQHNWRYCNKCRALFFAGGSPGKCASGGSHSKTGSGDYVILQVKKGVVGQDNWRWCRKCQLLSFAGTSSPGSCAAGGSHDHNGSGDYVLHPAPPPAPAAIRNLSPSVANAIVLPWQVPTRPSLPMLGTRVGATLTGYPDKAPSWFLPTFSLLDGIDPTFTFAAAQIGTDATGAPLNVVRLALRLHKASPAGSSGLREAPIILSTPTLELHYSDASTGESRIAVVNGAAIMSADDSIDLVFDHVLGANAVILFRNLRTDGAAVVTLGATYRAWQLSAATSAQYQPNMYTREATLSAAAAERPASAQIMMRSSVFRPRLTLSLPSQPHPTTPPVASAPPPPTPVATTSTFSVRVPLGLKYGATNYSSKYTLSTGTGSAQHVILNIDDLRNFSAKQSEFRLVTELGDVSSRFPSISYLYLGQLSRVIIAIPARFVIQRGVSGCAAACQVLLDSGPGGTAKFQFDFLLRPDISAIDLALLAQTLKTVSGLADCQVTLPAFLRNPDTSSVRTLFATSTLFAPGARPHTFALTVSITDGGVDAPAIANANALIRQLATTTIPTLGGTMGLRIDDALPDPTDVPIELNFGATSGSEDTDVNIDTGTGALRVMSHSPYDLNVTRMAYTKVDDISVHPISEILNAGKTLELTISGPHDGTAVLVDTAAVYSGAADMDAIARYLSINVQDVQNIACNLGINAGAVAFQKHAIASIDVLISFDELPNMAPVKLTLTPLSRLASASVPLPTDALLGRLPGTIALTLRFADPNTGTQVLSLRNDFINAPIFVVGDDQLFPPAAPTGGSP